MSKRFISILTFFLIFVTTGPIVFPAFAGNSVVVASETKDIDGNGYPDIVFSTTNGFGDPIGGIRINITFVDSMKPFLTGSTNSSGILYFRNVPGGNYTWISSSGTSGSIEIPYILFDISREESFLIAFLITKWCENTTEKGSSVLRGLAELVDYQVALPETANILDNFERARLYYDWLAGLEDFVITEKGSDYLELVSLIADWVIALKQVHSAFGRIQSWYDEGYVECVTDGVKLEYNIGTVGDFSQRVVLFNSAGGSEALILIVLTSYDLFVKNGTDVLVRVITLGEATWQERLQVIGKLCNLASGLLKLTYAVGKSFVEMSTAMTSKLAMAAGVMGGLACFISAALNLLELGDRYGGDWNLVLEDLANPYVLLTMFEVAAGMALGAIIIASALGLISASSILAAAGPIGIAIGAALAVVAVLKATLEWLTNYWAYIESVEEQISANMDDLVPIRELLMGYNVTKLEQDMNFSIHVTQLSLKLASQTRGEVREALFWAADYFAVLSDSQRTLADSVRQARPVVDRFISTCLYFDSEDGTKHIRAHLEGINSTHAEYSKPDGTGYFPFIASIYHPAEHNPTEYVYDNHTITSSNLDGEYSEVSNYDEISWWYGLARTRGGWAWKVPVEIDTKGREFAVTYTTDSTHHPKNPTGANFFFDSAGQFYSWRFDPDGTYRSDSRLSLESNTNATSFFYHYKLFYDDGTTWKWYGGPNALDEWLQSLSEQQPDVNATVNGLFSALNGLKNASSRKPSSSLDSVPPTTTLAIGEPKKIDLQDNTYVSSSTRFTLKAEDNPHGTGIAYTLYRIENNNQSAGWEKYSAPISMKDKPDGKYIIEYYSIDLMGNVEEINAKVVILERVHSDVQFVPSTLDSKKQETWVTAHIEIPNLYNITNQTADQIDVSTVLLNATFAADIEASKTTGDFDGDTIVELLVKFNATAFLDFLNFTGIRRGLVVLSVTGQLEDGVPFEGIAFLRVGTPADINHDGMVDIVDMAMAASAFGSYPGHPRWNSEADANNDNVIDIFDLVEIALDFGATDI